MFSLSICVITNNMGAIEQKRASFSEFEILTHALLDLNINLLANEMQLYIVEKLSFFIIFRGVYRA